MCSLANTAAALPRVATSVRGRAADLMGVIPNGCKLTPGDLLDLVRIEPAKTVGEPRWDGWTDGSPTNRVRVTLYKEDIAAIREAGHQLPASINRETAVNVPFYLGKEQDRFMWRIALVPPAEPEPVKHVVIECRTSDLAPGDVIWQQYSTGTNTVVHHYEVVANLGKLNGREHHLTIKDLDTGTTKDVQWGGLDHCLDAGPKVTAYRSNPALCVQVRSTARPKWVGVSAKV